MWRLCLTFADIALHRRGPDVLPASQFLLGLVLAVYFAVGIFAQGFNEPAGVAVVDMVLDRVVYLGFIWLVLDLFKKRRRFMQTAAAAVGVDVLMNVVSLPLLLWNDALQAPPKEVTLPSVLMLGVVLWSIDVGGFIVARALSKPYIVGLCIVIVYVFVSLELRHAFFPVAQ